MLLYYIGHKLLKYLWGEKMSISSKVLEKKKKKELDLYNAAFDLFISKGINDTAIVDIVKKAGVAKGTFYLYFKDKYDVLDKIIVSKSGEIIERAHHKNEEIRYDSAEDTIIGFIDNILKELEENDFLLKLIHKNLSWGLYKKAIENTDVSLVIESLKANIRLVNKSNYREDELEKIVFLIVELTSSTAYSCIIRKEPSTIDEMKPILYTMIRKMIKSNNI